MDNVHPSGPVGAREPVNFDFGGGRATSKVFEGLTLHELRVPVQTFGAVIAGRPQLHSLEIGLHDHLCKREATVVDA